MAAKADDNAVTSRPPGAGRALDTRSRVLDVAERLVQVRGFNGFSYADVAAEVGVSTASLHHHFPGKAGLGEALMARYAERFGHELAAIDASSAAPPAKLEAYADLYAVVLRGRRMCLCGMLAAEQETLAGPIRDAVLAFLDEHELWLEGVLREGHSDGSLAFGCPPNEVARSLLGGLEGAMLLARTYDEPERFQTAARRLLAGLAGTLQPPAGTGGGASVSAAPR